MSEGTVYHVPSEAHGTPPPMPHILVDWEWGRFMSLGLLEFLKQQAIVVRNSYVSRKLAVPVELTAQLDKACEAMEKLLEENLPVEEYRELTAKQVAADRAMAKELPEDDPLRKGFLARAKVMEEELLHKPDNS